MGKRKFSALGDDSSVLKELPYATVSAIGSTKRSRITKPAESSAGALNSEDLGEQIASSVALVGFQGVLNRMVDVFQQSASKVPEDASVDRQAQATHLVMAEGDFYTQEEMLKIFDMFIDDKSLVNMFLSITDSELRRKWLCRYL